LFGGFVAEGSAFALDGGFDHLHCHNLDLRKVIGEGVRVQPTADSSLHIPSFPEGSVRVGMTKRGWWNDKGSE
jgi:hypothetical protein